MMAIFGWICFTLLAIFASIVGAMYVAHGGLDLSSALGEYSTTAQKIMAIIVIVGTVWMWYLVFHLAPFTIAMGG